MVNLKKDKFLEYLKFLFLNLLLFKIYFVTCSLSEKVFAFFHDFSNDLKLKISTSNPSGYVGSIVFET